MLALDVLSTGTALALATIALHRELGFSWRNAAGAALAFASACATTLIVLGVATGASLATSALAGVCLLVSEVDRRSHIIPDVLVLAVCALAVSAPFGDPAVERVIGGLFIGALFYVVHSAFRLAGRDDALGLGDVKFAAGMGAFLGPQYGLIAVALAGMGTIAAISVTLRGPKAGAVTAAGAPFGIGLSAALCLVATFRLWSAP